MSVLSRRRPAVVVAVLVTALVFGRAAPAGAFLSAIDPAGWAVVAQMAAVISQAVAIKRQVENVRNQARAAFFGKIAPLTGKLMTMRRHILDMRSRASLDVLIPSTSVGMLPADLPPMNQPPEDCVGVFDGDCLLPDRVHDTATFRTVTLDFRNALATRLPGTSTPAMNVATQAAYTQSLDAIDRYVDQLGTFVEGELDEAERERAENRALIETLMATVEDWRGCQTAPSAGGTLDVTVDDRVPCVTNEGRGREDPPGPNGVSGTDGLQQELVVQLEALENFQDGDISQTQIDTVQTKMLIQLARLDAARAEMEARSLAREQEAQSVGEVRRRRDLALLRQGMQCRNNNGPMSYWQPTNINGDPNVGACTQFVDRSAAALANLNSPDLHIP